MRREGDVLLVGQHGEPLLVWKMPAGYQRRTAGFVSPRARERWDERMGRGRNERPPDELEVIEQAAEEGRSGEGREASEDRA